MKVQEYIRENGSNPYQKWFDDLDAIAAAKVTVAKSRLELGNTSSVRWFDGIGEYRIDWGPGYRIYLAQDGKQLIVLFGGGTKKSQQSDIDQARELYQEYKRRNWKKEEKEEVKIMTLTRDFKETVNTRVQRDPEFAVALLDEAVSLFLNGEPEIARLILRDLVNATVGFEKLAVETSKPSKSLHRMLSAKGNPTMDNLTTILNVLRKTLHVEIKVQTVSCA